MGRTSQVPQTHQQEPICGDRIKETLMPFATEALGQEWSARGFIIHHPMEIGHLPSIGEPTTLWLSSRPVRQRDCMGGYGFASHGLLAQWILKILHGDGYLR